MLIVCYKEEDQILYQWVMASTCSCFENRILFLKLYHQAGYLRSIRDYYKQHELICRI